MTSLYLASMRWPGQLEPVCVGTNKKKLVKGAVRLLRKEHGDGPVVRPGAMCSAPIQYDDIEVERLPYLHTKVGDE